MEERRTYRRFKISIPVQYKFAAFQDNMTRGSTLDVSASGLRLRVKDKPSANEEVHLLINLPPNGKPILLAAKAVWSQATDWEDYQIGLKLADTKSEDGKAFMDFYSQQFSGFVESNKDQEDIVA